MFYLTSFVASWCFRNISRSAMSHLHQLWLQFGHQDYVLRARSFPRGRGSPPTASKVHHNCSPAISRGEVSLRCFHGWTRVPCVPRTILVHSLVNPSPPPLETPRCKHSRGGSPCLLTLRHWLGHWVAMDTTIEPKELR